MRIDHRAVVAVLGLSLLCSCASSGSFSEHSSDAQITSKVKARLSMDPEINPFRIDVDTHNGVVTLSGTVRREIQKDEAVHLARTTTGVVRVVNEIRVGTKAMKDSVDDTWIVTKITSKLAADPEVNPFTIDVDCHHGTVILRGTVRRPSQRIEAEKLALGTTGVREVINKITLKEH